ncbi:MAG: AraC family ligand binding domain-containing protein [Burkholderiaceae bacterium]
MDNPAQRPFHFSKGRPDKHVFQTVTTLDLAPRDRYACWTEEVLRSFDGLRPNAQQLNDFNVRVMSLAHVAGEMHYARADGYEARRSPHAKHDELSLLLVLEGQAGISYDDGTAQRIEAGKLFFLMAHVRHQYSGVGTR